MAYTRTDNLLWITNRANNAVNYYMGLHDTDFEEHHIDHETKRSIREQAKLYVQQYANEMVAHARADENDHINELANHLQDLLLNAGSINDVLAAQQDLLANVYTLALGGSVGTYSEPVTKGD